MGSKRLGLVAIDATPVPGLKRPFNFLGSLAEKELSKIKQLLGAAMIYNYRKLFITTYDSSSICKKIEISIRSHVGRNVRDPALRLHVVLRSLSYWDRPDRRRQLDITTHALWQGLPLRAPAQLYRVGKMILRFQRFVS